MVKSLTFFSLSRYYLVIFLTKEFESEGDIKSETLGLSKLGGICQLETSCNVNQNTGLATAVTIAHEMAHNLNADHAGDECGLETIMTSELKYYVKEVTWSDCTSDSILNFLE